MALQIPSNTRVVLFNFSFCFFGGQLRGAIKGCLVFVSQLWDGTFWPLLSSLFDITEFSGRLMLRSLC